MSLISGIDVTSEALTLQRLRMDVIAGNIANAHTTRDANGQPYQRKEVAFESYVRPGENTSASNGALQGVRLRAVEADTSPGPAVHNPGHPDADENGMVRMSNVNTAGEMVDLINTTRAYEANLAVFKNSRQMALKALSIGR